MTISRALTLFTVSIMLVLVAGCTQDAPAKTAEEFVMAVAANDLSTLEKIVDPAVADEMLMGILFQAGIQALVGGASAEVVDLEIKTLSKSGDRATVSVQGDMKTNVLGTSLVTPLDMQLNLVKIDGEWFVTE